MSQRAIISRPAVKAGPVETMAITSGAAAKVQPPAFFDVLDGELFKVSRQWMTWLFALGIFVMMTGGYVVALTTPLLKTALDLVPLAVLYQMMSNGLLVVRVFGGTFLIILTARLLGMEYSGGTIRVLLGRGVGRLQLLGAKLLAISVIALAILMIGILYNGILACALLLIVQGNLSALSTLDGRFWADTWLYIVSVIVSMGATILMAAALTTVARSLAFGLAAGLSFFAADNIGLIFLYLAHLLTGSDFWLNISAYFLGPNLNAMPEQLLSPDAGLQRIHTLPTPWVSVDLGHTLAVTLVWSLAFAATTIVLTRFHDVNE